VAYSRKFNITTTRQLIVPVDGSAQEVLLHSHSGVVYIGGADVTVDNGYQVDNDDKLNFTVHPGDSIYAVTNSGSTEIVLLFLVR
jgi:hypothetical protein